MNPCKQVPGQGWTAALAGLCLALLAALSACGPGVGGTGTGSTALVSAGATAAALCGSALAAALQCAPAGGASTPTPAAGTARVWWADSSSAWRASARVEGDQIEFTLACEGLVFTGTWGVLQGQAERFFGSVAFSASGRVEQATLVAVLVGSQISLQLNDAAGLPLAPPRLLQVLPALPAVATCGP